MAQELMAEEYKSLRAELLQLAASISRWQIIGFVSAGIVLTLIALVPYPLQWRGLLVVPALVVIAGCLYGIIHDLRSILRIAAYIQVAHEGLDTGAMWETRQETISNADIWNPLRPYMTPIPSLLWLGLFTSLVGIMPSVPVLKGFPRFVMLLTPVMWLVFWSSILDSYRAFATGAFKRRTMEAFYGSLRHGGRQ